MVNFVRPATQVVPFEDLPSTGTPVSAAWLNAVDGALEVDRVGAATYDIGTAERLRALILAEQQQTQATPR